ncbi:MAG TPA: hypothetical protein VEG68_04500, partial [Terriglobales bacterium]|nr:hypothetical protein [Terriglobales bacterium]
LGRKNSKIFVVIFTLSEYSAGNKAAGRHEDFPRLSVLSLRTARSRFCKLINPRTVVKRGGASVCGSLYY